MSDFDITPVPEDENIPLRFPTSGGKWVDFPVPPLDLIDPDKVKKALETSREFGVQPDEPEFMRHLLLAHNPTKGQTAAVEKLRQRQLVEVSNKWAKASEVSLGESSSSSTSSTSEKA